MTLTGRWFLASAALAFIPGLASAQIGSITGPANSLLICSAYTAGTPELRPEGYTELVGDIVINCTGGPPSQAGAAIPTANIVVYISPAVPITSRLLGPGPTGQPGPSEAMLIIDEPGSSVAAGATGGYGPRAPQSLCTTAQQLSPSGSACAAQVGLDNSGQYYVAVVPGTSKPAQNVYQGSVGDFGFNSVAFYNVPVLPPAYEGVSRTFRITNIRIPFAGGIVNSTAQAYVEAYSSETLPLITNTMPIGVVGPFTRATVNAAPTGNPLAACVPQTNPTLAAQVTFTEGFATSFKTRVVPGGASNPLNNTGNTTWAAEAQNLVSPANQNIPGGLYGGFAYNDESGFIVPTAAFTVGDVTYTAGLTDFGTRLKAVFSNIPAGVTLYVSTTSTGRVAIPGGTSATPYAVLVASGYDANGDGAAFAPLTSAIVGSDGLFAYPLAPDQSGVTAAIWEVVNSDPAAVDSLTFSVYVACAATVDISPPSIALSYAPEPGGGSFSSVNGTYGLTEPLPRFIVSPCANNGCSLSANTSPLAFSYSVGGTVPISQFVQVTVVPNTLPVGVTPQVDTPLGGTWLSASLGTDGLYVSVSPWGLLPSYPNAYTGYVQLYAQNLSVMIPVYLTIYPQSALSIVESNFGNFVQGEPGGIYTISVSNGAAAGPTSGTVTVTESPPPGMTVTSMASTTGTVWSCSTTTCTTTNSIGPGASYPAIILYVDVSRSASSPLTNMVSVSGGGSSTSPSYGDVTTIVPALCIVTGGAAPTVFFVQDLINQALGVEPAGLDLNSDGIVNVTDIETMISAMFSGICPL